MRVLRFLFTLAAIALIAPGIVVGNDDEIAAKIVEKLQTEKQAGGLKGFTIELEVEKGTVWLSGKVANQDQQQKALEIARRTPGVKQVVNDLAVTSGEKADGHSVLTGIGGAMKNALFAGGSKEEIQPAQAEFPIANGPAVGAGLARLPEQSQVPQIARTSIPQSLAPQGLPQQGYPQQAFGPQGFAPQTMQGAPRQMINPQPVAMSHATSIGYEGGGAGGAYPNQPVPIYGPGSGVGAVPARYDHPQMPNYSWPSYAAYPNYAAVTYPKQYSPTAWPYIGPFYPYPQVPLGWRKVTLEWDDGWWFLDFKDHRHR